LNKATSPPSGYDLIAMAETPSDDAPVEIFYQSIPPSKMVRLAQYSMEYEAELSAAALNNEGIRTQLFGANVNAVNWLAIVGTYDSFREMRDAQTVLASGRIRAFVPPMAPRGDRPAGVGKRFILRVAEADLNRAKALLADEAQDDSDEPRCPKCGSWRILQPQSIMGDLAALVGLGHERQFECLACHYRAKSSEFLKGRRTD
jgi:hypothetical protein